MKKVFVVQNQLRMNHRTGELEPKYRFDSAKEYGELIYLLSPTARPFSPGHVISVLTEKLEDYDNDDSLLLVGNPVLIGFAVAIAADFNGGRVRCLQWSGTDRRYIAIEANLYEES